MPNVNNNLKKILNTNFVFLLTLLIYFVICFILLPLYKYEFETDGISYISLALKYSLGDIKNAVNGYWSPLLSWLLAQMILLNIEPIYAFHLLNIFIGAFSLWGIKLTLDRYPLPQYIKMIIYTLSLPIIISYAMTIFSPDLLLLCLLVFYLYKVLTRNLIFQSYRYYVEIGIIAAFAYLAKAYALPFFIVHFIFLLLILYFFHRKKIKISYVVKRMSLAFMVYFMVAGCWILIVSLKYKQFTYSTSGALNFKIVNSSFNYSDFQIPPNKTAIFGWEDPSLFTIKVPKISIISNIKRVFIGNMLETKKILDSFSIFSLTILIMMTFFLFLRWRSKKITEELIILNTLLFIIIYALGYTIVHVEDRFFWLLNILLVILGFYSIQYVIVKYNIKGTLKYLMAVTLSLSFLTYPYQLLKLKYTKQWPVTNRYIYDVSKIINSELAMKGRLASNSQWNKTSNLAYFLSRGNEIKYYGVTDKVDCLAEYSIQYYLYWKNVQCDTVLKELESTFSVNRLFSNSYFDILEIKLLKDN